MLLDTFDDLEFHQPKRVNEPELISSKKLRDMAIDDYDDKFEPEKKIESIYSAAKILRKAILDAPREFNDTFSDFNDSYVPLELTNFFRWLLVGPNTTLESNERNTLAQQRVMTLSQSAISSCLTDRQVKRNSSAPFRKSRDTPREIASGIIRHSTGSKKVVNILSRLEMSSNYAYLIKPEKRIGHAVLEKMIEDGGNYIPPDFVSGRYIFFAIDNVDFREDTMSGQITLHATAMAVYQQVMNDDAPPEYLNLSHENNAHTFQNVPETITPLSPFTCRKNLILSNLYIRLKAI